MLTSSPSSSINIDSWDQKAPIIASTLELNKAGTRNGLDVF